LNSHIPLTADEKSEFLSLFGSQIEVLKERDPKKYGALLRHLNQIISDLSSELKATLVN
jgi:hypothetical protein